jgi:hypothetical protein
VIRAGVATLTQKSAWNARVLHERRSIHRQRLPSDGVREAFIDMGYDEPMVGLD